MGTFTKTDKKMHKKYSEKQNGLITLPREIIDFQLKNLFRDELKV